MNIFIPYIARSTNAIYAGLHFTQRIKEKRAIAKAVAYAIGVSGVKKFNGCVDIEFEAVLGKKKKKYDVSNYSFTYKLIEDCLVEQGILSGDSSDFVNSVKFHSPVRGDTTGVKLKITEVSS